MHRPGPAGGHLPERFAHGRRYLGGVIQHPVPFRHRREQGLLVEFGQGEAPARCDRNVGIDRQHRHRGLVGLGQAGQDVGGAAAARPLAHADPAADAGIAVGHVGGGSLVAGEDVGDAVIEPEQRIVERQRGVAAQPEHVAHAEKLQHADQRLGAGEAVGQGSGHVIVRSGPVANTKSRGY